VTGLREKKDSGFTNPKLYFYLAVIPILFFVVFMINSSNADAAKTPDPPSTSCSACGGVNICQGANSCCSNVDDGVCPQDYGDWAAADCADGCQNEDVDCCRSPDVWNGAGWSNVPSRNPYNDLGQTENFCCGNDPNEYYTTTVGYVNPTGYSSPDCCSSANQCAVGGECNDIQSIGGHETCDYTGNCVGVSASSSCYDGMDNNCDNKMDFCDGTQIICSINIDLGGNRRDPDCISTITGTVYNSSSGGPLEGAVVKGKQRYSFVYLGQTYTNLEASATTDAKGEYTLIINGNNTFDFVASHDGFAPKQQLGISAGFRQSQIVDFYLDSSTTECKPDCTTQGSPLCTSACEGWGGCVFYDATTRQVCDGKQPGFKVAYSPTQSVTCCTGIPYPNESPISLDKKIITDKKNIVRIVKPLIMDGQQVNMVIDVFS